MSPGRARPSLQPTRPWRRAAALVARRRRLVAAVVVPAAAAGLPSPVSASSGGGRRITDTANTRTVYLVGTVLIVLAIGLAVFTWWFWRSTRREHEALAPLEVMGDRKFLASDALARQVMLDGSRPVGAAPLAPGAPEPLALSAGGGTEVVADVAPATLVPAAVGEVEGSGSNAGTEGDVGVDAESDTARTDPPATNGNGSLAAVHDVEAPGEEDVTGERDAEDDPEPGTTDAGAAPDDGDATTAIDVTMVAAAAQTDAAEPVATEPDSRVEPAAGANGSGVAAPIDPGLPVPPVNEEPERPLSLAELVALQPEAPMGFDDDDLVSTPSTGIPVIESAEAWVERQLVGTGQPAPGGSDAASDAPPTADDDPDEPTPAAVHGAE